jgi:hypothetical protein
MVQVATTRRKPEIAAMRLLSLGFWSAQRPSSGTAEWRKWLTTKEDPWRRAC